MKPLSRFSRIHQRFRNRTPAVSQSCISRFSSPGRGLARAGTAGAAGARWGGGFAGSFGVCRATSGSVKMPPIVKAPLSLPYLKPLQVRANFRRTKTPAILGH